MPIKYQEPPEDTLETLRESAETMPRAYAQHAKMIRDVLDDLDHHWPHPVYIAGLKDMASSGGLSKAEMIGWRYLAQSGSDRNYAIEVQQDPEWEGQQLTEIDKGPFIDGIYRVLEDKSIAQKAGETDLKLSVLRINAMGIFAVWLRADDPDKEIIVPVQPAPDYLKPWHAYSIGEFEDALKPEAKRDLKSGKSLDA
jgi:hypothetical protein